MFLSALTTTVKWAHKTSCIFRWGPSPEPVFKTFHRHIPKNSSSPWQRQPNKVAFDSRAEEKCCGCGHAKCFHKSPVVGRDCVQKHSSASRAACHLLLRWTDKTGWRGTARVTGQNYAAINPSISPRFCSPQRTHCLPCQKPVHFSDAVREEDSWGTCRLGLSGVGICINSLFRDVFWT